MASDLRLKEMIEQAMRRAIELARDALESGNYPLGAVVVNSSNLIVGEASSTLIYEVDPSAHPEVVAMRRAAKQLQSQYLRGCWLVSTMEPCPMCTSMAIWGKMSGIAFGTSQPEAIAFGRMLNNPLFTFRQIRIRCAEVTAYGDPKLDVVEGVHAPETALLLEDLRKKLVGHNIARPKQKDKEMGPPPSQGSP